MSKIKNLKQVQTSIDNLRSSGVDPETLSDGFHSFKELYRFRMLYNALLFNEWASGTLVKYDVHKSWKHNDGEWCFGQEKKWFVVVAVLPTGQITNHYRAEYWDLFQIPEVEKAKYEYDGHTSHDVAGRMDFMLRSMVKRDTLIPDLSAIIGAGSYYDDESEYESYVKNLNSK